MPLALVTGASRGLGRAIASELASRGYALALVAIPDSALEQTRQELAARFPVPVLAYGIDLAQPQAVEEVVARVRAEQGTPAVLVANAGIGDLSPFCDQEWSRVVAMLDLNVRSTTQLIHQLLPRMRQEGHGRVLVVSSASAFAPSPFMAVYAATKAYLRHLGEALSAELSGSGITVTVCCPGALISGFQRQAGFPERCPLFVGPFAVFPESVAPAVVSGLLAGRSMVTPGIFNRLSAWGCLILPRRWSVAAAGRILGRACVDRSRCTTKVDPCTCPTNPPNRTSSH